MPDQRVPAETLRIIDANLNRAAEGLRVLEDVARLGLNNQSISSRLKALRHELVQTSAGIQRDLLWSRDASGDVGRETRVAGETGARDAQSLVVANSRRVQESLRVLEEVARTMEAPGEMVPGRFMSARFAVYSLEQELLELVLKRNKLLRLRGLYVIVDGQFLRGRSHAQVARQAIRGGAAVVQLRDKSMPKRDLLKVSRELREVCAESEVLFIVNDHLDIALASDADGLHVGQEDLPVETARRLLKMDRLLGCSVSTVREALEAQSAGADHLGVGAVFATSSKQTDVVGVERLKEIKAAVSVPVVAIGGISKDNVRRVVEAGADAAAVISAVMSAPDPEAAARELVQLIEGSK